MEKVVHFCRSYLAEMLFAFFTIFLIGGFILCWRRFDGFTAGFCGAVATILEMCMAFALAHLPLRNYKSLRVTHYVCFSLWAVVFVIGIILSAGDDKELWILFALAMVTFCALFSDFAVVSHLGKAETKTFQVVEADACDDD